MFNPEKWPTAPRIETADKENGAEKAKVEKEKVEKEKIEQYLKEDLPESEERIKEPMDPNCEVSVVIPAYGERDYIFRSLESLADQKGVNPNQYEAIIVVNNLENEPKKTARETDSDYKRTLEHYHRALEENQKTLKLIRFINGENVEVELTDYEKQVIEKIKESGLRIFAVDKASPGKGLPGTEANVGMARNRGVAEAIERFYKQLGKNGIIAQTDADTRLDKNYIQNLISTFKERPKLIGLTGSLEFEKIEPENELFEVVSIYSEIEHRYRELLDFFAGERVNIAKDVHFSGANMASRSFEAAMVGGVPKESGGEDPHFGKRLSEIGEIDKVPEVKTTTADRPSPRTAVWAGAGQRLLRYTESIKEKGTIEVEDPRRGIFLRRLKEKFNKLISNHQATPENLKQILSVDKQPLLDDNDLQLMSQKFEGVTTFEKIADDPDIRAIQDKAGAKINELLPMVSLEEGSSELMETLFAKDKRIKKKYEVIKKEMVKKENSWAEKRIKILEKLTGIIFKDKPKDFDSRALMNIIKPNKERVGLDNEAIKNLNKNSSILNRLTESIVDSKTRQEAMDKLKVAFKDKLTRPEENPLRSKLIELKAVDQAVKELRKLR